MSSILHSVPDVTTFAANVVVFLAAIGAAVGGSLVAVKAVKKQFVDILKPEESTVTKTQVIGGILQDQYGSAMMAEALRNNSEGMEDLVKAVCELKDEMREARHQTERLIDRMNDRGR